MLEVAWCAWRPCSRASRRICPRPIASRRPGGADGQTLRRAWDLKAETLRDLQEDGTGTVSPRRASHGLARRVLGPSHLEVAEALDLLGRLLERGGDYPEGQKVLERALGIKEAALGAETADVADTIEALAIVLQLGGKLGRAPALRAVAPDPGGCPRS